MSSEPLKNITPDSRNKLVGLVNKTAEFVVSGNTPTEALVKAAGSQQYTPEFILRAAEAYNGAAHLHHFKQAAADNRGDTFDLVDGHQVLRDLIANDQIEKASNTEPTDLFSDSRYYFELPTPQGVETSKQASSVPSAKIDFKDLISSTRKLNEKEKVAEEQARQNTIAALTHLQEITDKTKQAFCDLELRELTKIGSELLYTHGLEAAPVARTLCDMSYDDCVKIAEHTGTSFRAQQTPEIEQALEVLDAYTSCQSRFSTLADKQASHYINSIERAEAINSILGIDPSPRINTEKIASIEESSPESSDLNDLISPIKRSVVAQSVRSGLVHKGLNSILPNSPSGGSDTGRLEDYQLQGLRSVLDPAFLQEVKEIEIATKMKNILNDPVISSHPPRAIEEALAEVQSLAPNAVIYEPLLRAMLRKRLESEGRLDDLEISQLLGTDIQLAGRDVPSTIFPQVKMVGENN